MGSNYLDNFDETRKNFQANETTNLETYLAENPEIEFFRTLLANFKEQQVKTKNITEFFTIGIFKLNFIGMKKKALPAISKCIDKLYTILPKLAHRRSKRSATWGSSNSEISSKAGSKSSIIFRVWAAQ